MTSFNGGIPQVRRKRWCWGECWIFFFFFILVYISIIIISIIKSVVIKMNRHYFLSGPHIFRQGYVQDIRYSEAKTPEPYILSITLPEYMRDSPKVTSVRNYNRFNNRSTQFMAKWTQKVSGVKSNLNIFFFHS